MFFLWLGLANCRSSLYPHCYFFKQTFNPNFWTPSSLSMSFFRWGSQTLQAYSRCGRINDWYKLTLLEIDEWRTRVEVTKMGKLSIFCWLTDWLTDLNEVWPRINLLKLTDWLTDLNNTMKYDHVLTFWWLTDWLTDLNNTMKYDHVLTFWS